MLRQPPIFTLVPYTTLFRSVRAVQLAALVVRRQHRDLAAGPGARDAAGGVLAGQQPALQVPGVAVGHVAGPAEARHPGPGVPADRKSTRLNSSHSQISYAVF